MRSAVRFASGVAVLIGSVSTAQAGDYHAGATLVCADCHVMHASQAHAYVPGSTAPVFPTPDGPHEFLLRREINDLCLTCHDGQGFAPDVLGTSSRPYPRSAGALNQEPASSPYFADAGHTLGSPDVAPGGTWADSTGLNCVHCHSAHGGGFAGGGTWNSYRNLGGYGTAAGATFEIPYSSGPTNPLTSWVHEDNASGMSAAHYGVSGITFNEPISGESRYAEFCGACHTDFHGEVGSPQIGGTGDPASAFERHPTAGANIGALGGGHSRLAVVDDGFAARGNQVPVMSPLGQRPGSYDGSDPDLSPSCMSCHKAHGNQNSFGLIYMTGAGTVTEEGDGGGYVDLCHQCHIQGLTGDEPPLDPAGPREPTGGGSREDVERPQFP